MKFKLNFKKILSVIATSALLFNSLAAPLSVLAEGDASGSAQTQTPIPGCMNQTASNYNADATIDDGTCATPALPPIDVCPNIDGGQATVPEGYELSADNQCVLIPPLPPKDLCPNIEGDQTEIPKEMIVDTQGNCITPPPVDVCPNIDDVQATVPDGYELNTNNQCVLTSPPPANQQSTTNNQQSDNSNQSSNQPIPSSPTTPTPKAPAETGHISAVILENTKVDTSAIDQFDISYKEDGSASISTDKLDYSPTDSVLITGVGFIANKVYEIIISSNDEPAVNFSDSVTTSEKGELIYSYQLDGNARPNYKVEVKDREVLIASTTFTDSTTTIELKKVWSGMGGQTTLNIGTSKGGSQIGSQQTGASGASPLTTGQKTISAGNYYLSEAGGLDNYGQSLYCFNDANNNGVQNIGESTISSDQNNKIYVSSGQRALCTFTNTLEKVTICHATGSSTNPYNQISPNIENDGSLNGGHLNHTGGIYPAANWGDIIPPYSHGSFSYSGMNWPAGQTIWNNDCNIPTGTIKVIKDVRKPDGTDTSDTYSFTVQLNGTNNQSVAENSPYTYTVTAGSVDTISEVTDTNYAAKGCKLVSGAPATNFTVSAGQNVNVTCTNWQKTATITVIKDVVKSDGSPVNDDHVFHVKVNNETKDFAEGTNAVFTVNPGGPYSAVESSDPNYTLVSQDGSVIVFSNGSATIHIVNKQKTGSIKVCKVIIDAQGNITNGADMPASTFTITWTGVEGAPNLAPTVFNSGYTLTDKIFSDSQGNDANCINYPNIPIGSYDYSEEAISGAGWETPKYNDQYETKVLDLGDFYEYTSYNGNPDSNGNIDLRNNPPGPNRTLVILNQYKVGSVTVTKFEDLNQNSNRDEGEPTLDGWNITLGQQTQGTENGQTTFGNLLPATYSLSEEIQDGWAQTAMYCDNEQLEVPDNDNQHDVIVQPGQTVNCYIGNYHLLPGLHITKSNDKPTGVTQSDTVTYTLTLENTGNVAVTNISVQDVPPGGFTYVAGSTTVDGAAAADPVVAGGMLTWINLVVPAGEKIVIAYKLTTPSDLVAGTYTNYAACSGGVMSFMDKLIRLTVEGTGVSCDPASVTSQVSMVQSQSYGGNLVGQVLGASTSVLPATGSPTALIVFAIGAFAAGLALKFVPFTAKKTGRRKYAKN